MPLADDDRISGSASATLSIDPAKPADSGAYEVVVSNDCGSAIGGPVELVVYAHQDHDGDGDVDLDDFADFQGCFNGPNRPYKTTGCEGFDVEPDDDIDLIDFSAFQSCFNGPNRVPRPTCE